jgi:predicted dehydrogenase
MTVRVAVVGVGSMGASHARVYSTLPGARLVAVCDSDPNRSAEIASRFGVEALTDCSRLVGAVDAVSVAVPTNAHAEVSRLLLERGISVLVEKPMARTSAEAAELVEAADRSGARLMVGHIERFNPAFMAIGDMHVEPLFIECDRISPFKFRSADIGVIFDLMIHDIDLILHLAKSAVSRIDAVGVPVIGVNEDICNARFLFESGCVANVTASRVSTKSMRKIRLFSRDAYITIDTGARQALIYRKSERLTLETAKFLKSGATSLADFAGLSFPELLEIRELKLDEHEPLAKELAAFVKCVAERSDPPVSGREGLDAIRVAEAVVKAAAEHAHSLSGR